MFPYSRLNINFTKTSLNFEFFAPILFLELFLNIFYFIVNSSITGFILDIAPKRIQRDLCMETYLLV